MKIEKTYIKKDMLMYYCITDNNVYAANTTLKIIALFLVVMGNVNNHTKV